MQRVEAKIQWLRTVLEKKETLFGQFSDKLTKTNKIECWKEVHAVAQALCLVPVGKDYTYCRDVLWQNLRKSAMKKRDNSRQTGSGGGVDVKVTAIDSIIFEIIGKDTPVMDGLPILESLSSLTESQVGMSSSSSNPALEKENIEDSSIKNKKSVKQKHHNPKETNDEYEELKLKKLKLTVELLQKEKRLKELQIKKLEKELELDIPNEAEYLDETYF